MIAHLMGPPLLPQEVRAVDVCKVDDVCGVAVATVGSTPAKLKPPPQPAGKPLVPVTGLVAAEIDFEQHERALAERQVFAGPAKDCIVVVSVSVCVCLVQRLDVKTYTCKLAAAMVPSPNNWDIRPR